MDVEKDDKSHSENALATAVKKEQSILERYTGQLARYTYVLAVATICLMFATLGIAFLSWQQLRLAQQQSADTETQLRESAEAAKATRRQVRAYVYVSNYPKIDLSAGADNEITVTYRNESETPAYVLNEYLRLKVGEETINESMFDDTNINAIVSSWKQKANAPNIITTITKDRAFTVSLPNHLVITKQLSELVTGTSNHSKLYLWGAVIYRDAFQCMRYTTFCEKYDLRRGGDGENCPVHNDVDNGENCE
jgi:hypothetical protein